MEPLDDIIIQGIFRVEDGKMVQKENDKIEYKVEFDISSKEKKAKIARECAALYNYEGGYIVFGVDDDSRELIGLSDFLDPDNADIANFLNSYFSPHIKFHSKSTQIDGKNVFILYIEKRSQGITICLKDYPGVLSKSTIYWRYSGKSAPIEPGDMANLMSSLRGEETKKLTDIAEKDFKAKYKPIFRLNGGRRSPEISITLENRGPSANITGFEIIDKNVDQLYPPTWKKWPLDQGKSIDLQVRGSTVHYRQLEFKLIVFYHDEIDTKYKLVIGFDKGNTEIIENKEIE